MFLFKSIWANLVFFSSLLVLAIAGAFLFFVVDDGTRNLLDIRDVTAEQVASEMRTAWLNRAQELAGLLASSCADHIYRLDVEELKNAATIAAEVEGVLYVSIHDEEGRFLADTRIGTKMVGELPMKPFARRATASSAPLLQEGIDFLEVAEPVHFAMEKIGTVRIGVSLKGLAASTDGITGDIRQRIDMSIELMRGKALFLALVALVTTLVAVGLFSHHLAQPIRELARGTERIASGDLTFRARAGTRDEIGELARSFNRMTEDLESATVSRNYVDNIIKNVMGCLIVTSPEGHIRRVNESTLNLLGYEEEVLINLHIGAVFLEEGIEESKRIFELIKKDGLTNAEASLRARDGRGIPVLLSGSVIVDKHGEEQGVVCVALDITDRKKQEEAIEGYVKKLEQNNHILTLFTDILSHDLLNPANIITHMSALVMQKKPLEHREEMEMIHRNSKKLTQLIRDASDYARFESGESLAKELINLDALLHNVVERYRHQLEERGMHFDFQPHGDASLVANPMIEDIFSNLLSNCLKYTPEGTSVAISVESGDDAWIVSVADHGEGIPDRYKEAVFERFERHEKKGVKGSGLGLAIARRLAQLHDGAIWIEDTPGGGCTFKVRLPKNQGRTAQG